jgi:hypothetical protein
MGAHRTRGTGEQRVAALAAGATKPGRGNQTCGDSLCAGRGLPTFTSLEEMVEASSTQWTVEQCFEEAKEEVGLDEYEVRSWQGWYRHMTLSMLALAFFTALRANGEKDALKKSLRHQSQKPPMLLKPMCLLISWLWFPSVFPKSGDFSFISQANSLSRLPITWPGHAGDAHIKPSRCFAKTFAEALSPVIYNCRTRAVEANRY